MAVYDCFTFFNENDLLELRLNQHWDYVDKFIIVEAGETHTGLPKDFNFDHQRFEKYSSKIIYRKFADFESEMALNPHLFDGHTRFNRESLGQVTEDWVRDHFQGNYLFKVLTDVGAVDKDIVYLSALDEIVSDRGWTEGLARFEKLTAVPTDQLYQLWIGNDHYRKMNEQASINIRPVFGFEMDCYVYKFNLYSEKQAVGMMTEYSVLKQILPSTTRSLSMSTHPNVKDGGWHFSFLDDTEGEKVLLKHQSWAHSRDTPISPTGHPMLRAKRKYDFTTAAEALHQLKTDYKPSSVPVTAETHPRYLIENLDKYKKYLQS